MKLLKSLRVVRSNKKKIESFNQASREREKLQWLRNHRVGIEQDKRRQYSDEELLKVQRAHQKLQTEVILLRQDCEDNFQGRYSHHHHGLVLSSEEIHVDLYRELNLILQEIKAFNHIQTERLLQEYQTDEEVIDRMLSKMSVPERVTLYRNVFKRNHNHCIFPSSIGEEAGKNYDVDRSIPSSSSSQQRELLQKLSRNDNKVNDEDDCCTCAICLEKFDGTRRTADVKDDDDDRRDDNASSSFVGGGGGEAPKTVVWSETEECKHVFCEECIVDYFSQRSRKVQNDRIRNHPCPICRREFCTLQKNLFVEAADAAQ